MYHGPSDTAATQLLPRNKSASLPVQVAKSTEENIVKVPQVPLASHGNLPLARSVAGGGGEKHSPSAVEQQNGAGRATTSSIRGPESPAINVVRTDTRPSPGLQKGSYRGSPVVDVRLATDVNHNTVKALRSVGPSDFQAVREIGQGAFGKVCCVI